MSKSKKFLNVGIKKGTFYLTSKKQEGDDWEKQEFRIGNEDMVRYHKNVSVNGKLTKASLEDTRYKGQCLKLMVDDGEAISVIEIPVYQPNSKIKATDQYFQSAVSALESIEIGDTIGIIVNSRATDKNGELYKNLVFFNEDNELIKSQFQFSEVPRWEQLKTVDKLSGKEVTEWNPEPTNEFYFDKFRALLDRFSKRATAPAEEEKLDATPVTPEEAFEPPVPNKDATPPKEELPMEDQLPF